VIAAEPWVPVVKAVILPPLKLWFRWRFEGLERVPRTGPAIVACNHISYLDPLANAYAIVRAGRLPRFLGKADLFRIPVVGAALRGTGQIPVERGSGDPEPMRRMVEALRRGEVVAIYPEGTVTTRPDGLPMEGKTGAVRLSLATGVPVFPMASWGSQGVWQKTGKGSVRYGRPIWVRVGAPLDFSDRRDDADDRDALKAMTARVMDELTGLAVDLRERYPMRWAPRGRLAR
jgi:1-acyl-sn-glycerol-3-phosphate acyltransferase